MRKIAPHSANKGRLRPSFFFWCSVVLLGIASSSAVLAQEQIYRCGREYTNAPKEVSRCERLLPQSVTVIPGLKPARVEAFVAGAVAASASSAAPLSVPALPADAPQKLRDQQARAIVAAELDRTRQRHAELLQEYRQGAPLKSADEEASPHRYQKRVAQLKAAIERHERDIDSLQRELARRPAP